MERGTFVDANDTIDEFTKEERNMPIKLFMTKGFPLTCKWSRKEEPGFVRLMSRLFREIQFQCGLVSLNCISTA